MRAILVALLALALVLTLSPLLRAEEVAGILSEIRFVGNEKTRESVMLQEMTIHVGEPVDMERIEASRQAIMNLGLFKEVTAELERESVLVITVKERFYVLPLPLLDVRPEGDYSYGAELRLDNLGGINQRLKLTYEEGDSISQDTPHSQVAGITYAYPRIVGTPYQLDVSTKVKRTEFNWPDDGAPLAHYRLDGWNSALGASRWALDDGASRGWRYGGGVVHQVNDYLLLHGEPGAYSDGQAVSTYANLDYIAVDEHSFYREGVAYGVRGELGMPVLDSDYSFSREKIYYRSYRHLSSSGANINSQWQFGFANGCAFSCAAYDLGGSSTLRGYASNYVAGNIFALLNLEYHHPMSRFRQLRGVLFTDIGDAWSDMEAVTLGHPKGAIGVGLRWTVQSFVDLTLRYDYGYAIDSGTSKGYFSTRGSF